MTTSHLRVVALTAALTGVMLSLPVSSATGQSAATTAATQGHQRFVVISTDPSSNGGGPIAGFGPIHAKGTDVVINNHRDRFEFPAGNVVIRHKAAKGGSHQSQDRKTCYLRFTEHGTWTAVSGTGAYAKVAGGGTYRVLGNGFGCHQNQPPEVFSLTIRASGHLKY